MHQTRQETITQIPITRKGTKYVVRAVGYNKRSVPVLLAVREMLKLARTAKEVRSMVHQKLISINGSLVRDYKSPVQLFHILKIGEKSYVLHLLPTRKFAFEEIKDNKLRLCKVINKRLLPEGKIQLNLIDGTNIISKEDIKVGDSIYLKSDGKIDSVVKIEKGKKAIVILGAHAGHQGVIESVQDKKVNIKLKDSGDSVSVDANRILVQ